MHKNYKDLKVQNPAFPFLIRECSGIEAKVWARYGECVTSSHGPRTQRIPPRHPSIHSFDATRRDERTRLLTHPHGLDASTGFGKERVTSVEGLDASGVEKSIKDLVAAASP